MQQFCNEGYRSNKARTHSVLVITNLCSRYLQQSHPSTIHHYNAGLLYLTRLTSCVAPSLHIFQGKLVADRTHIQYRTAPVNLAASLHGNTSFLCFLGRRANHKGYTSHAVRGPD